MLPPLEPPRQELFDELSTQIQETLGDKLVGLYLYGSLVTGDFTPDVSDIDLMAAITDDIDEMTFQALNAMQDRFIAAHPVWQDRLEIAYVSLAALKTFKSHSSKIVIISPGEPFHIKDAGNDWLINWHMVREQGLTLIGPPPQDIIAPITQEEFIHSVKTQVQEWREWIYTSDHRPWQAYAILTICRALYACRFGTQVSKLQAARWAKNELPEWDDLIANAILWRQNWRDNQVDHAATLDETHRFVHFLIDKILAE